MAFLILHAPPGRGEALADAARRLPSLDPVFTAQGVAVLARAETVIPIGSRGGVVIGRLHRREGARGPAAAFTPDEVHEVLRTNGTSLIANWWGAYVAAVHGEAELSILRDPAGMVPAYEVSIGDLHAVVSDLEILVEAGLLSPKLDWEGVRRILTYPHLRGRTTGLSDVTELTPGSRLRLNGHGRATDQPWSPWTFVAPGARIDNAQDAASALRTTIDDTVTSWAAGRERIVVELSGGLDSSLVALGLAGRERTTRAIAVNLVTPTPDGDERIFARLAADAARLILNERPLEVDAVDLRCGRPGLWPRPASHAFLQPVDRAFAEAGRAENVDAFFSGLGGDNVLCFLNTAAPVADALRSRGPGPTAWRAVSDVARLHDCTLWRAATLGLRKAMRPDSAGAFIAQDTFLTEAAAPKPDHPWLESTPKVLPGKREHVRSVIVAQGYLDRYEHAAVAPVIAPLLSQPILELALRIPTWMWVAGGRNRAVARQAYADLLPSVLMTRRSKGGLGAMVARQFDTHRAVLADLLCGGVLVEAGLLRPEALARGLDPATPTDAVSQFRLLQIADVEVWARRWLARA